MTRFTDLRFDDFTVGELATVPQRIDAQMVSRWSALLGYGSDRPPSSLALTWLLQALGAALGGIPAGGVLLRHELSLGEPPEPGAAVDTTVRVEELTIRRQRQVVVFVLDSRAGHRLVVCDRMHLIWPSGNGTGPRPHADPPMATTPLPEPMLSATVTQADIDAYADISGDYNPLHVDPEAGLRSPFGSTIAHGPLPLAYVQRAIEDQQQTQWPSGLRVDARFRGPTRPGDRISVYRLPERQYVLAEQRGRLLIDVRASQPEVG